MFRICATASLLLFLLPPVALAQNGGIEAAERDPVTFAVEFLLSRQEIYEPDRPVGRKRDNQLEGWRKGEEARLQKVFKACAGKGQEWPYEGVYRIRPDGRIPPGYRVGGTAIVCTFLLEAPGYEQDKARQAAVMRSVDFILEQLEKNRLLSGGPQRGYDVRGWGHSYALDFFLRAEQRKILGTTKRKSRVKAMIKDILKRLKTNERDGGGWNYTGGPVSAFMTGPTCLALFRARELGYKVPAPMVERALDALARNRSAEGVFAYSGPTNKREKMGHSAARAQIAELTLLMAGRSTPEKLLKSVNGFFQHWDDLYKRKSQQGTHIGPYSIAPYYFFFGHRYTALAIEYLPEKEKAKARKRMVELMYKTRDKDGRWNDRIFPRTASFSTAMTGLGFLAPQLPKVARWSSKKSAR